MVGKRESAMIAGFIAGLAGSLSEGIKTNRKNKRQDERYDELRKDRDEQRAETRGFRERSEKRAIESHQMQMQSAQRRLDKPPDPEADLLMRVAKRHGIPKETVAHMLKTKYKPLDDQFSQHEGEFKQHQGRIDELGGEDLADYNPFDLQKILSERQEREVGGEEVMNIRQGIKDSIKNRDRSGNSMNLVNAMRLDHRKEFSQYRREARMRQAQEMGMRMPQDPTLPRDQMEGASVRTGMMSMAQAAFFDTESSPMEIAMAEKMLVDAGILSEMTLATQQFTTGRGISGDQILQMLKEQDPTSELLFDQNGQGGPNDLFRGSGWNSVNTPQTQDRGY